jgi:hypothetical protein
MTIAQPIVATTVAISAGFSILMFSIFTPTAVFGLLMMLAMASALSGGLIILPALLSKVSPITLEEVFQIRIGGTDLQLKVPLLKGMTRFQIHRILKSGVIRHVDPGLYLFEQGDVADSMYVVISGVFDAIMVEPTGDSELRECIPKRVNRLEVGDVIGEMGIMTSGARCVSVVAAARGEVLELSHTHLERIRLLYPRTASRFLANLTSVLTEKLIKADKSLSQSCILDDDTGILNRDAFLSCLDKEISRALRFNDPLALCLLEVDDQNNEFEANPLNAERFICEVANVVSGSFRKADTFGRLDKSTIAIICVRATGAFSDSFYGRLKSGMNAQSIRDMGINTTISYRFIDLNCLLSNKIDDAINDLGKAIDSAKHKTKKKILNDSFHAITYMGPRN